MSSPVHVETNRVSEGEQFYLFMSRLDSCLGYGTPAYNQAIEIYRRLLDLTCDDFNRWYVPKTAYLESRVLIRDRARNLLQRLSLNPRDPSLMQGFIAVAENVYYVNTSFEEELIPFADMWKEYLRIISPTSN